MTRVLLKQAVSGVEKATEPLLEIPMRRAIEQLIGGPIESCSDFATSVVGRSIERQELETASERESRLSQRGVIHPFIGAVLQAYVDHRPLVLSPDMFWLLITQGLALHINNNPDDYRHQFGASSTKELIAVRYDGLCKGALENPWKEVFDQFSSEIQQRIGGRNHSAIVAEFSTTGRVEKAAFEVALMDCVKSYFDFRVLTLCGIPEVVLEGEVSDWFHLRDKTQILGTTFNVTWWTDELITTLDEIAENAAGKDNPQLWETIYKQVGASGGPFVTGWILKFFPYLGREDRKARNPLFSETLVSAVEQRCGAVFNNQDKWCDLTARFHITTEDLPSSLCKVPFEWDYLHQRYNMEFLAGFTGFTQDVESLQVRPKIGWAVREVVDNGAAEGDGDLENESTHITIGLAKEAISHLHAGRQVLYRFTTIDDDAVAVLADINCGLSLNGLTSLSDTAAESLGQHRGELWLNGLTSVSNAAAESLAKHQGPVQLKGLTNLSNAARLSLLKYAGYQTAAWIKCLTSLTDEAAAQLAQHRGSLIFDSLTSLPDTVAESLSSHQDRLELNALSQLSDAAAESLSKHAGRLDLNGLTSLSDAAAESLSQHQGVLYLTVVTCLSDAAARSLGRHKGVLNLKSVTHLSDTAVESLSHHHGDLWLMGLVSLSDAAAKSLSKHEGRLDLRKLTKLTDEAAESLSQHTGELCLNGLTSLSDAAAVSFGKHRGSLRLNRLRHLSTAARESLSNHEGVISLDGLARQ